MSLPVPIDTAHKDPAILEVLGQLQSRLGSDAFVVTDHWESDRCAIGISSPRDAGVLVYISCDRELPGMFGYELELPPLPGDAFPYRVMGRGSGVSFEELVGIASGHTA